MYLGRLFALGLLFQASPSQFCACFETGTGDLVFGEDSVLLLFRLEALDEGDLTPLNFLVVSLENSPLQLGSSILLGNQETLFQKVASLLNQPQLLFSHLLYLQ